MTAEQKRELQTIRAKDLFSSLTTEEREKVVSVMRELLENRAERPE